MKSLVMHSMLLLLVSAFAATAGLIHMNMDPACPVPPAHLGTDGDIYYQESYGGAGSYDIDCGWYQACLWDTNDIVEPYLLETIGWYGWPYYAQNYEFYLAPADGDEPGDAEFLGTFYNGSSGAAGWYTHTLDTPVTVLPESYYYLIMKPLEYSASGYWWCSNIEVTSPHASLTSTDLSNWIVDYQSGGFEYLAAIWMQGEPGGGDPWMIRYTALWNADEAVNACGVPVGAVITNNSGAAATKKLYITTDPPSQYLPLGNYTFEPGPNTWYGCVPVNEIALPSGTYNLLILVGDAPGSPDATDDFVITLNDSGVQ